MTELTVNLIALGVILLSGLVAWGGIVLLIRADRKRAQRAQRMKDIGFFI